jgi:hypothetical protein
MTDRKWNYPAELADALLTFGLAPTADTSPLVVRDALNDLYRYEIRRLKQQFLDGRVTKADYSPAVVVLRKKYWPLSLQPAHWEEICREGRDYR